jgi:hypothetical protein
MEAKNASLKKIPAAHKHHNKSISVVLLHKTNSNFNVRITNRKILEQYQTNLTQQLLQISGSQDTKCTHVLHAL